LTVFVVDTNLLLYAANEDFAGQRHMKGTARME